jgi:hypothetical protein
MSREFYYNAQATGNNDGSSKTHAFTTYAEAVTAANQDGDIIYRSHTSEEDVSGTTTYTYSADIQDICINFDTGLIVDNTGYIGSEIAGRSVILGGQKKVSLVNWSYKCTSTSTHSLTISNTNNGCQIELLNGTISLGNATSSRLNLGASNASACGYIALNGVTYVARHANQVIVLRGATLEVNNLKFTGSLTSLNSLFIATVSGNFSRISNTDFSYFDSGQTIVGSCTGSSSVFILNNCKFPNNYILKGAQAITNLSGAEIFAYDCAVGDTHIAMHHANAYGETVTDTGKYANDNIGLTNLSWKVTTNTNPSTAFPYKTPWITRKITSLSEISPFIEIIRDGVDTPYTDAQVWIEAEVKTTDGSVVMTTYSDKVALLGTPANQETGSAAWTNVGGTTWKGKLSVGALTPAELHFIRMRVCVGVGNTELWLDPQVRI